MSTLFTDCDGLALGSLNDIVFDTTRSCHVVDTTARCLYYVDPATARITVAGSGMQMPNGAGLSPHGRRLYVSETFSGRVLAWNVTAPGSLSGPEQLHMDTTGHGWDGLSVDGAGNVCVANLELSGISVISSAGEVLDTFVTPVFDPFVKHRLRRQYRPT